MFPVGPRKTEYASTNGMISATIRSSTSSSKKSRNQNAKKVTAASLAKFASTSRSPISASTARTPSANANGRRPRARARGSTSQSKRKTAGISANASSATSHQIEIAGIESAA